MLRAIVSCHTYYSRGDSASTYCSTLHIRYATHYATLICDASDEAADKSMW